VGNRVTGLAALVALALLPLVVVNPYARHVLLVALMFGFVALGLNLVFGYAGQHAFGHPVFFGVGAYASALLAMRAGWPIPLAVPGAGVVTAVIALAVAYPSFRLRGIYFGMVTFAFARVIYIVAQNWIGLTRGPMGIPSVPTLELMPAGWTLGASREVRLHVTLVALLGLTVWLLDRLIRSDVGRAWVAIRENEDLAASLGIPPLRYKMAAFAGGAALAAIGGGFYAHYVTFVSPTELGFHYIGIVFIMVIAGGTGTLVGPVIGAIIFGIVPELLRVAETARNLLLGTVLLVTIAFLPEGLVGLWARVRARRGGAAFDASLGPEATATEAAPSSPRRDGAESIPSRGERPLARRSDTAARIRDRDVGQAALEIEHVSRRFGGLVVLRDVSFRVDPGEIVGLIGPNGAGKTTLFNIVTGVLAPTDGRVRYGGQTVSGRAPAEVARHGITRTFQITSLFPELSVEENVRTATHLWAARGVFPALARTPAFRTREAEVDRLVEDTLAVVGLTRERAVPARALSYGAQRELEIAVALATRCRLLLLDEPAAGLNPRETGRLRDLLLTLRDRGVTIVLIEHDTELVMGVSDRVVVLHHGEKIGEGAPETVTADPRVIEAYLGGEVVRA
jgi:branched-chain amino acid transport system permease protein